MKKTVFLLGAEEGTKRESASSPTFSAKQKGVEVFASDTRPTSEKQTLKTFLAAPAPIYLLGGGAGRLALLAAGG